jgi:hypothetical protein
MQTRHFLYVAFIVLFSAIGFHVKGQEQPFENAVRNEFQFNGYTNYWHDTYSDWYRYGNLYKMAIPDVEKTILQSKVDVAEDMGIPGLIMQEGFLSGLLSGPYDLLDQPGTAQLESALSSGNVLVFVDPGSATGQTLTANLPVDKPWPERLGSHQYGAVDLVRADAFMLENGDRKLFVVSSPDVKVREQLKKQIENTEQILQKYELHKGWFGAETLLKSVTCTKGHPLEVIGAGMNEGNSWFVFNGYMDFLAKDELEKWMNDVKLPVVTDVGFWPIFGCKDYEGLQVQSMFTTESWIDYAREKGGYIFRQVWDTAADKYDFDGYLAIEGNKEQIDNENVPFIMRTGRLEEHGLSSMVLFIEKGKPLTHQSMWEAILDRREVGVLEQGKMMGPALYRNAMQMLLLDRIFLEAYFGDRINLETKVEGYKLQVTLTNSSTGAASGKLDLTLPAGLKVRGNSPVSMDLPPGDTKTLIFDLQPGAEAMDYTNPVAVHFHWEGRTKSTLAMLDLPQAISVHRLLYGHAPQVGYPVTIHNFTGKSSFPVKVQVVDAENGKKVVYKTTQTCVAPQATFKDMLFKLELPAGNYRVITSALGVEYESQLGVGKAEGKPYAYTTDLNADGINEFRLENDSVQITLLTTGARVIEYIVKSRNDNVLFKAWPEKAIDDKRPFRKRGYYPYGGFEDFLGQGSMETHRVYDAEMVKKEGDYVRVRMWTDYFGNRLEKTFTLYGNSPLLEVRFALTFKNPEANVLGPQPILELGKKHWTEDVFIVPEMDGLQEYRMKPEKYYGRVQHLKEGWNAGYDTKEDITFVGAYPVDQPLFLHMWMNHPSNSEAHHYYVEFQPWTPIYQKSTMYFTYYLWGAGGPWENGVKSLREMNLITTR